MTRREHGETQKRRNAGSGIGCHGVARRGKAYFTAFLACVVLWHCAGCLIDAGKLAGYSNPKASVRYNPWTKSFEAEAGTDFAGKLDGSYNPETKAFELHVDVASGVSPVVAAEGERADHLIELRKIEATYLLEAQKAVGENFKAFGQMLAIAAAGGGEAVAKVVDAAAPILKGSALGLGAFSARLGAATGEPAKGETPAAPPPLIPAENVQPP